MNRNILFIVVAFVFISLGTVNASENTMDDAIAMDNNIVSYNDCVVNETNVLGSANEVRASEGLNMVVNETNMLSSSAGEDGVVQSNSSSAAEDGVVQSNSSSAGNLESNNNTKTTNDSGYTKIYVTDEVITININSTAEFKQFISNITNYAAGSKNIVLNLTSTTYDLSDSDKDIVFNFNTGNMLIKGNNALITSSEGNIVFRVGTGANLYVENCRFTKAKPAIRNYGTCYVVKCVFDDNKRDSTINSHVSYRKGGAIDNYGTLTCIGCNFTNNRASYGGAVCCEENSDSTFINCLWGSNSAGGSDYGEDIYIHNSAFAQVFYNSTSQKLPSYAMQSSAVIQLIDTNDNSSTNNKVYNANNVGDVLNAFSYISNGVYSSTNVTINLKNTQYTFNQDSLLKEYANKVWDVIYCAFEDPWESAKSIWGMIKNVAVESVDDDIKDSGNSKYLCWVKAGLTVTINGNGATFYCDDSNYRLFYIVSSANVVLNNLTIKGFATSILNNGVLTCNGVTFSENKIDYVYDLNDIGGAVRNYGAAMFTNCNFVDNYANKGGAIYNEGGSVVIDNCTFKDNYGKFDYKVAADEKDAVESSNTVERLAKEAWNLLLTKAKSIATFVSWAAHPKTENDIYSVGGLIKINTDIKTPVCSIMGKNNYNLIYAKDRNMTSTNYFDDLSEINKLLRYSNGNGVYSLTLNDKNAINKTIAKTTLDTILNNWPGEFPEMVNELNSVINSHSTHVFYENDLITVKQGTTLILDGSNEIIKSYAGESGETHFIYNYGTVILKNIVLDGFNKAILNYGQLVCENVTFKNCRVNYATDEDYGGAISNVGNAIFNNCTFVDNYAKYGAAVYNIGSVEYINCTGINNVAYSSGAGFYDDKQGCSKFDNCTLNNSLYILNDGADIATSSAWTYVKNSLIVAGFIASFAAGAIGGGAITSALGKYGGQIVVGIIGGLTLAADIGITATLNNLNHVYVSPGEYIVTSFEKALTYLGTAAAGYSLGVVAKNLYNKFHPDKKIPVESESNEITEKKAEIDRAYNELQEIKAREGVNSQAYKDGFKKLGDLENELWDLEEPPLHVEAENADYNIFNISVEYD